MTGLRNGQHGTLQTAQVALGQITSRKQSADPRSYALWYNFAAGHSGLLNATVNQRLSQQGKLTSQDVEEIYTTHISPGRASEHVNKLGAQVSDEISQVMAMIEAVEGSTSSFSADLADASKQLVTTKDRAGIRAIVENLVLSTKEMEAKNAQLQSQLHGLWAEIAQLRRELESIRSESLTDALTLLGNRKFFNTALEKSMAECLAGKAPLALLLADVDHFKGINDTFGHVVGDRVLRFVAQTIKRALKGDNIAARYGGEEFAIILPKTSIEGAVMLAEQVRQAITKGELVKRSTGEKHSALTISIGVAALHEGTSAQALIEAADVCLYAAKRSGRNCVVSEIDEKLLDAVAR